MKAGGESGPYQTNHRPPGISPRSMLKMKDVWRGQKLTWKKWEKEIWVAKPGAPSCCMEAVTFTSSFRYFCLLTMRILYSSAWYWKYCLTRLVQHYHVSSLCSWVNTHYKLGCRENCWYITRSLVRKGNRLQMWPKQGKCRDEVGVVTLAHQSEGLWFHVALGRNIFFSDLPAPGSAHSPQNGKLRFL